MTSNSRRQNGSCPYGGAFYKCNSGFEGCCFQPDQDPCNAGATCPKEKDRTPGRYTPTTITTTVPEPSSSLSNAVSSATSLPTTTFTQSQSASASSTLPATSPPAQTTLPPPPPPKPHLSTPAILGIALSMLITAAIALIVVIIIKRQKRRQREQLAATPLVDTTPREISGMSDQLEKPHKLMFRRSDSGLAQLDGREISRQSWRGVGASGGFAELPAEPVARWI